MAILLGPMANAAAEIYQSHSGRFIRLPRQHFWQEAKVIECPHAYIHMGRYVVGSFLR